MIIANLVSDSLIDYTNESGHYLAIICCSVTAPQPIFCVVTLYAKGRRFCDDGPVMVDTVFCGGNSTHTWWQQAGHGLVPGGVLLPGERVVVALSGRGAVRMDIDDGGAAEWT